MFLPGESYRRRSLGSIGSLRVRNDWSNLACIIFLREMVTIEWNPQFLLITKRHICNTLLPPKIPSMLWFQIEILFFSLENHIPFIPSMFVWLIALRKLYPKQILSFAGPEKTTEGQEKMLMCSEQYSLYSLCVCVLSRVWLFAGPWTVARQALPSTDFQVRIAEQVAISYSRRSAQPRDQSRISWVS